MGDVIHTLPALTDAAAALPGLRVDWVVEAPFADLAGRHPAVDRVLPSRLREWRRHPLRARRSKQVSHRAPILDVQHAEFESGSAFQQSEARLLQGDIVIIVEIVDADDFVVAF